MIRISTNRRYHVSASYLSALLPMLFCAALSGCARHSPVSDDKASLHVTEREGSSCFEIEREPGEDGGLRIPRQIVCPSASTSQEDKE